MPLRKARVNGKKMEMGLLHLCNGPCFWGRMSKLSLANLRKTINYLKKNGLQDTFLAAGERLQKSDQDDYVYEEPSAEVLALQRKRQWDSPTCFSVLVPVYNTPETFYREMIESVLGQTYPHFQLILADASKSEKLRGIAEGYEDERITYVQLEENAGIAENTNQAMEFATGDYIALLDHDDLLTFDALYYMAEEVYEGKKAGCEKILLYSDEDKCNGDGSKFYEPHFKQNFNLDLLLTNNYICHFTAVRSNVAKKLKLHAAYDGAQDFDFVLRVVEALQSEFGREKAGEHITHIPKVLYHWRCHENSTALNTESKRYAYEAGKRAVEDYAKRQGWDVTVEHLKHLGFYRIQYPENIWEVRPEIAVIGGNLYESGKISGGLMKADGEVVFKGLRKGFSGYMNRAALIQQAPALDIRNARLSPAAEEILKEIKEEDPLKKSLALSKKLRSAGYILLYDPQFRSK